MAVAGDVASLVAVVAETIAHAMKLYSGVSWPRPEEKSMGVAPQYSELTNVGRGVVSAIFVLVVVLLWRRMKGVV